MQIIYTYFTVKSKCNKDVTIYYVKVYSGIHFERVATCL